MHAVEEASPLAAEVLRDVAIAVAERGAPFTSDDVWTAAKLKCREPRVLGPVLMRLAKERVIEKTGRLRQAHRGVNHARPQTVWQKVPTAPVQLALVTTTKGARMSEWWERAYAGAPMVKVAGFPRPLYPPDASSSTANGRARTGPTPWPISAS